MSIEVSKLLQQIRDGKTLVGDGAMGTMLFSMGLEAGDCPERLNIEKPEVVEEVARLYADAGSDIVQTNTFGGCPLKLAQYGLDVRTEEINIAAVRAARKGAGTRAFVAASCGPSGKILKPYGDTEPEDMFDSFKRQLSAVTKEGIDLVIVETMTDIEEAKLAVRAAKTVLPEIPVAATMTFDKTPRGFFTIMGVDVEQAARELGDEGADIIGSNCGNGIENMVKIAAEFSKKTTLPLIIQSNAGLPTMEGERLVYSETPEFMAEKCEELLRLSVSIIGGCCGTTPAHISAVREMVQRNISSKA